MTSELLLSKLPVTRRVLFLIFLVFSLRNTLFLVNYTTYPWIGSGIFRLAAFCNSKKESVAADPHTFPLVSLQQGLLIPLFSVSWAPLLEFFWSPLSEAWRFSWHEWKFVQTPLAGVLFGKGGSSPSKTWFVVCVSSHRFWQPGAFVSAAALAALLVSFCRESQAMLSNPCVCLNKWWVQEEIISPIFSSLGSLISLVIPGTAALQWGWRRISWMCLFFPFTMSKTKNPVKWDRYFAPHFSQWEGKLNPLFEKGKRGENWVGNSPMSDWDVPKALFEDLLPSLCQEQPFQGSRQLSQQKRRGYFGEISISKASPQFSSK